jgi:hypothetical protein
VWPGTSSRATAVMAFHRICGRLLVVLTFMVGAIAALAHQLRQRPLEIRDPSSPAALRADIARRPSDGVSNARLALALLKPTATVAPNADEASLYGADFTLHHPNVGESRVALEAALKYAPNLAETAQAHQAVLMAEGRAEEAIQPGRRALDLTPTSAHAYAALARAHLLAACAQGCAARMQFRAEKKAEKRAGRKSALEAREESARKRQEKKTRGGLGLATERSQLRAGAMWRIMEAGRLLKQGAEAESGNEEAKRLSKQSRHLISLDAHQVLTTEQVLRHGECAVFFGQELQLGEDENERVLCDKARYAFEG